MASQRLIAVADKIGTLHGQQDRVKCRQAIVIGNARARGTDRCFCGHMQNSRLEGCLPDAGVRDVSEWAQDTLKGEGEQLEIVHIVINRT